MELVRGRTALWDIVRGKQMAIYAVASTFAPVSLPLIKVAMDLHIQKSPAVIYNCGAVETCESTKKKTLVL